MHKSSAVPLARCTGDTIIHDDQNKSNSFRRINRDRRCPKNRIVLFQFALILALEMNYC